MHLYFVSSSKAPMINVGSSVRDVIRNLWDISGRLCGKKIGHEYMSSGSPLQSLCFLTAKKWTSLFDHTFPL